MVYRQHKPGCAQDVPSDHCSSTCAAGTQCLTVPPQDSATATWMVATPCTPLLAAISQLCSSSSSSPACWPLPKVATAAPACHRIANACTAPGTQVVVFSWSGCPFCKKAKALLSDLGVQYTAVELDTLGSEGKALRAELAKVGDQVEHACCCGCA
jgi:hypothetical protein